MASAFQKGAFQQAAFQLGQGIASTAVLQHPVDCVLAGEQRFTDRWREYDIRPRNEKQQKKFMRSGVGRLSGDKPSFTVTTSKRGY